jgi:hypothetical protein
MTEQALCRVGEVVQREIAGETFLVPVRGHLAELQELIVLNEVGSWLWARLDGQNGLDDLVESVVAEFEVDEAQAKCDIESFLDQLHQASLLRGSPSGEAR